MYKRTYLYYRQRFEEFFILNLILVDLTQNKKPIESFMPNLTYPLINTSIFLVIISLVFWAFFSFSIFFIIGTLTSFLAGFIYIILRATISIEVGDDFLTRRNIITNKTNTISFEKIRHFDVEKGVLLKLKSGLVVNIDNKKAMPLLVKQLNNYGLMQKTVNVHDRPHLRKH